MIYIKKYIEDLRRDKTRAGQYILQTINWSGTYMSNTLFNDVLSKVMTLTMLRYSGTELFVVTVVTVMLDSYDAL